MSTQLTVIMKSLIVALLVVTGLFYGTIATATRPEHRYCTVTGTVTAIETRGRAGASPIPIATITVNTSTAGAATNATNAPDDQCALLRPYMIMRARMYIPKESGNESDAVSVEELASINITPEAVVSGQVDISWAQLSGETDTLFVLEQIDVLTPGIQNEQERDLFVDPDPSRATSEDSSQEGQAGDIATRSSYTWWLLFVGIVLGMLLVIRTRTKRSQ